MKPHSLPKVRLRAMEPEDLDMLYRIENDTQLWDVGSTNVPYSRYTLHDFIAHSSNDIYADRQVRLIVEDEQGNTVGLVDLINYDPRHNRAEVGIVIVQPARRKGYAQAAMASLHHYASGILHLHQLYVVISVTGADARHLFSNMGYRETAVMSDWLFDGHVYNDAIMMQKIL
jgi:diamine N-acetyltransferase